MDISAALARTNADLEKEEALLVATQARVDKLKVMREGLQLASESYEVRDDDHGTFGESEQVTVKSADDAAGDDAAAGLLTELPAMEQITQTELFFALLKQLNRPAETQEVRALAAKNGYEYSQEQVRSTLTYLMRSERIRRISPGVWEVPRADSTPNGSTPVLVEAGVAVGESARRHYSPGGGAQIVTGRPAAQN